MSKFINIKDVNGYAQTRNTDTIEFICQNESDDGYFVKFTAVNNGLDVSREEGERIINLLAEDEGCNYFQRHLLRTLNNIYELMRSRLH